MKLEEKLLKISILNLEKNSNKGKHRLKIMLTAIWLKYKI